MTVLFYLQLHPDAQPFKTRLIPNYNDLRIIFGHTVADGRYSLSCFDVDFEYEGTNALIITYSCMVETVGLEQLNLKRKG